MPLLPLLLLLVLLLAVLLSASAVFEEEGVAAAASASKYSKTRSPGVAVQRSAAATHVAMPRP
jgi:regulator of protease activity HflC (stomatin/prohibitin superfamily)